jgi:putative endonuclease
MALYIYIIQSDQDQSYYKGFTEDYSARLIQHNNGLSTYTSRKMPWRLVYVEIHETKTLALKREKNLKKADRARIEALIVSSKNILNY